MRMALKMKKKDIPNNDPELVINNLFLTWRKVNKGLSLVESPDLGDPADVEESEFVVVLVVELCGLIGRLVGSAK